VVLLPAYPEAGAKKPRIVKCDMTHFIANATGFYGDYAAQYGNIDKRERLYYSLRSTGIVTICPVLYT
jgi:hypothetical protein